MTDSRTSRSLPLRPWRRGTALVEVLAAVVLVSVAVAGTAFQLRQFRARARENYERLVADTLAWDVLWKSYNARVAVNTCVTNNTFVLDWSGRTADDGVAASSYKVLRHINERKRTDGKSLRCDFVCTALPETVALGGKTQAKTVSGWVYAVDLSWYDHRLDPKVIPSAPADQRQVRRLTAYKSPLERYWRKVQREGE